MNQVLNESDLVAIRRDLHAHPELSNAEARTGARIAEVLRALGYTPRTGVAGHGVVAVLEGDHPGPTLLYRADIDALPIQEVEGRPHGSTHPGVMHACGHDVHTTVGLGVASAMRARRAELRGRIVFVFQPAEEAAPPPGQTIGAERMVEEGVLDAPRVDAAFALHVMPLLDAGTIGYTRGPVWAASDLFDVTVEGRMAHGAYPHEGVDAIHCAAMIVQALQQIPSRNIDAREACVISLGRFQSGTAYNILPAQAHLQGLIRTHCPEVRQVVLARFHEVVSGIATACGCQANVSIVRGTYRTANDVTLETFTTDAIAAAHPDLRVVPFKPQMGAEDFAAFSRRVPGVYLFLGVRNEERGITHMIHTPAFDVDESCLGVGVRAMVDALLAVGSRWYELDGRIAPAE